MQYENAVQKCSAKMHATQKRINLKLYFLSLIIKLEEF
jgi:hypothetical protein